MFGDPIIESYRLNPENGSFSGTLTFSYPSKTRCVALGLSSLKKVGPSLLKQMKEHARQRNRTELVYYREVNGKSEERIIKL